MNLPHEHGKGGEEGVEAPVLGEVGDNDGPHRFAGQHGTPRRAQGRLQYRDNVTLL